MMKEKSQEAHPVLGRKTITGLVLVILLLSFFALCLVSALQVLIPRNMPFGVTGSSPVMSAVQSSVSLQTISYSSESSAQNAINQGAIYGAFIPNASGGTLIVVPAKSFFANIELRAAFANAAKKVGTPITIQVSHPLPSYDPLGAVTGLLMLPLLIGGYLASVLIMRATGTAAAHWRTAILVAYSLIGALLTDLIAGPLLGAFNTSHFWELWLCFTLIAAAVTLSAAALQNLLGSIGTLVVVILFIFVGLASAGGAGVSLLPVYWQYIGTVLPPRNGEVLISSVLYFDGNGITIPLIVLGLYTLVGAAVVSYFGWLRTAPTTITKAEDNQAAEPTGRPLAVRIVVALAIVAVMQCFFSLNYTSAEHMPVANNLPFGVTGPSPLTTEVEKTVSLQTTQYASPQAAQTAIDQGQSWGTLIPGTSSNTLYVVPAGSDLAPLQIADSFEKAAIDQKTTLKVESAPPTLPPGDPFGIVLSIVLAPLLIGGYTMSTNLMQSTSSAAGPWRVAIIIGASLVAGLAIDLVVGLWLGGYPLSSFWIVWPIMAFIIATIALVAAVLQKLLGALGTLVTVLVVMVFGNPSGGGANGYQYLPTFWRDLGPFLPPRNAYILLRNTVYFGGNGISQALIVLGVYFVVAAVLTSYLGWFRTPRVPITPETERDATAMTSAVAIGPP